MALLKIYDVRKRTEETKQKIAETKRQRLEQYLAIVEECANKKIEEAIEKGSNYATINILPKEAEGLFDCWILSSNEAIQAFTNKLKVENYEINQVSKSNQYISISW